MHVHHIWLSPLVHPSLQELDRRRHLLRLWVSPKTGPELPSHYASYWITNAVGARGGVYTGDGQVDTLPMEAEIGK